MLTTYFKRNTTQQKYYSGLGGPYLDKFTDWLNQRGYQHQTIRHRLQGVTDFGFWAQEAGFSFHALPFDALAKFRSYLLSIGRLHIPAGPYSNCWLGAQLFVEFLQDEKGVTPNSDHMASHLPALVMAFEQWMQAHRGLKASTLAGYRRHLLDLLFCLGEDPRRFEVNQLRAFILDYAKHNSLQLTKKRVTASRAFLRFLIAAGYCRPGLEAAIPTIAEWKLSTLPCYLTPEDIERVIAGCTSTTAIEIRDKAIVLLLARLGLRAGEVAELTGDAIDWLNGTISVIGKSRRQAKLPLPQDVGDALLQYIEAARPSVNSKHIFIRAIAPWKPISSSVVKFAAEKAIRRAGIDAPTYNAHILRHSVATGLLRNGASLQVIGEVLRHRSIDTTAHYAKVDIALLKQVTQPWPGRKSCL